MAKCILLSRVSSEQQELDSQTFAIKNEAIKEGFKEDEMIIIEDKESAIKLSEEERNGLNRMKEEISKNSDITHVFIYELSRLSRRQLVLFSIRDYLIEKNIQLVCCTPYFRLLENGKLSQTANLMFSIFASMAESEMELKKERFKRAKDRNKRTGKAIGRVLYGYTTLEDKTIVVDEEKKDLVIDAFTLYATGQYSVWSLAKEICDRHGGVGETREHMNQMLTHMIYDERYCGDSQYPQMISRELFEKCCKVRKSNKLNNRVHLGDEALLKKIIFCKETGRHMTFNGSLTAGSRYFTERHKPMTSVKQKLIDGEVWKLTIVLHKAYIMDDGDVRKQMMKKLETTLNKILNLKVKAKQAEEKIDKVEERLIFGSLSQEKADALIKQLQKDMQYNMNESLRLEEEAENLKQMIESKSVKELPDYDSFTTEEKVALIRQMIDRVEVEMVAYYTVKAEIYTKVDHFVYTLLMHSYSEEVEMSSKMI